eukprot:9260-Heterococcus_DN1.PRE.1
MASRPIKSVWRYACSSKPSSAHYSTYEQQQWALLLQLALIAGLFRKIRIVPLGRGSRLVITTERIRSHCLSSATTDNGLQLRVKRNYSATGSNHKAISSEYEQQCVHMCSAIARMH